MPLFMVIETFRYGPDEVRRRFIEHGRMLPPGFEFIASWISSDGMVCYQLMEGPGAEALRPWVHAWNDLVEFQIVPVRPSAEFWEAWEAHDTRAPG
ncbi:MAG: DUF3303 family protein [Fimbriimonadaceae bacterium]|nr:DUF3303 family protein [Fimbriimonadaceae bacterium]QYK59163.1 MAG: DUF3303 family protein [Fimbriimonadaceae bacterium]